MGIDINRLKNVRLKGDGKIIAQCPACALAGNDSKGEHLSVFPDGRYGCVVFSQDNAHNKEIFALVGVKDGKGPIIKPFDVKRWQAPPSSIIMTLDRFAITQVAPEPVMTEELAPQEPEIITPPVEQPEATPHFEALQGEERVVEIPPDGTADIYQAMDPAIKDFLLKPASEEWVTL